MQVQSRNTFAPSWQDNTKDHGTALVIFFTYPIEMTVCVSTAKYNGNKLNHYQILQWCAQLCHILLFAMTTWEDKSSSLVLLFTPRANLSSPWFNRPLLTGWKIILFYEVMSWRKCHRGLAMSKLAVSSSQFLKRGYTVHSTQDVTVDMNSILSLKSEGKMHSSVPV